MVDNFVIKLLEEIKKKGDEKPANLTDGKKTVATVGSQITRSRRIGVWIEVRLTDWSLVLSGISFGITMNGIGCTRRQLHNRLMTGAGATMGRQKLSQSNRLGGFLERSSLCLEAVYEGCGDHDVK